MPVGLKGNSDGSGAIQIGGSDAISISTGLNTTFAGTITATGTVAGTTGTLYPLVSGTAVSATGTAVDFTGIPSWVRRITVMLNGVSTNGTSDFLVQIGSGSVTTSGYSSQRAFIQTATANASTNNTNGILFIATQSAADAKVGHAVLTNVSGNIWVASATIATINSMFCWSAGSITLGGTLDRVRITTVNGTDTFDAGTINILFE